MKLFWMGSSTSARVYACVCARSVMALAALLIIFCPCCPKADKGAVRKSHCHVFLGGLDPG